MGPKAFIGVIKGDVLRVYDNDNFNELSKSLGLDYNILTTPLLQYRWIHMVYQGVNYRTTRTYFYHHCRFQKIVNTRDIRYLELRLFGTNRALEWEEYITHLETAQLDLFTIMDEQRKTGENNNEFFRQWEESNKIVQNYQLKQKLQGIVL